MHSSMIWVFLTHWCRYASAPYWEEFIALTLSFSDGSKVPIPVIVLLVLSCCFRLSLFGTFKREACYLPFLTLVLGDGSLFVFCLFSFFDNIKYNIDCINIPSFIFWLRCWYWYLIKGGKILGIESRPRFFDFCLLYVFFMILGFLFLWLRWGLIVWRNSSSDENWELFIVILRKIIWGIIVYITVGVLMCFVVIIYFWVLFL